MLRALITLILICLIVLAVWVTWALAVPVQPQATRFVLLRPGWSSRHIAQELQAAGVIHSARAFLLMHYALGHSLKAGEYKFDSSATPRNIHERLVRGDIYVHYVVVPEGYNLYDIAAAIEQAGLGPRQDFIQAATDDVFLVRDFDPAAKSLEGYLFPDTYAFTRTQSMHDIAAAMVRRFRQEARQLGMDSDYHRLVTLASIIEKETAVPDERPLVASVYNNRLRRGIALGADPSVIYAALLAGRYQGVIRQSDLDFDSPYNTYKYPGLPPGPIGNPGRASLQAALHPADTDFLYFVSDGNGHHRFSRTLEEHSRNVAAYRHAVSADR